MNSRLEALYLLAVARNFNSQHHNSIVAQLGNLEELLSAPEEVIRELPFGGSLSQRLLDARQACDAKAELAKLAEAGIQCVGLGTEHYPELLAQVAGAPVLLFCKGNPQIMKSEGLAIVGSRKCSKRGLEIAADFARDISELGIPVVSGMALGIDAAAHTGALDSHSPTVAVLGCGVDVVYPPRHHELYERLCNEALVISEYPPGIPPDKSHFPQRNRIISGLSRGVLVVEAPLGSGALITARIALEQGREVFAVPGPITSPYTKGTHFLIKNAQAKLTEGIDDILTEFGTNRAALLVKQAKPAQMELGHGEAASAATQPTAALSGSEQALLEHISYEGSHVNELVRKLKLTTPECISHLTMLEIKGLISSASGGFYVRL